MDVPTPVVEIIALNVFPDVRMYLKLATVSPNFYTAFTSDTTWQYLDPYGWKTNIYKKFTEHANQVTAIISKQSRSPRGSYQCVWPSNPAELAERMEEELEIGVTIPEYADELDRIGSSVRGRHFFFESKYTLLRRLHILACDWFIKEHYYFLTHESLKDYFRLTHGVLDDYHLMWCFMNAMPYAAPCASRRILNNPEFLTRAILLMGIKNEADPYRYYDWRPDDHDPEFVPNLKSKLHYDRDFVLKILDIEPYYLTQCSIFRDDDEIVKKSVRQRPMTLQHASKRLRQNQEVVDLAAKGCWTALRYAGVECIHKVLEKTIESGEFDQEFVFYLIQARYFENPDRVHEFLRKYPVYTHRIHFCLMRSGSHDAVLGYYIKALKAGEHLNWSKDVGWLVRNLKNVAPNDREFWTVAVQLDHMALEDASEAFRDDPKIVFAAMKTNVQALKFASDRIKTNRSFMTKVADIPVHKGVVLKWADRKFLSDKELVLKLIEKNPRNAFYMSPHLKDNRFFISRIVDSAPCFECLVPKLLGEKDLIMRIVRRGALASMRSELNPFESFGVQDAELFLEALKCELRVLEFLPVELLQDPPFRVKLQQVFNENHSDKAISTFIQNRLAKHGVVFKDKKMIFQDPLPSQKDKKQSDRALKRKRSSYGRYRPYDDEWTDEENLQNQVYAKKHKEVMRPGSLVFRESSPETPKEKTPEELQREKHVRELEIDSEVEEWFPEEHYIHEKEGALGRARVSDGTYTGYECSADEREEEEDDDDEEE